MFSQQQGFKPALNRAINQPDMPALINSRWEQFCQYVAKGQTNANAYVLAGYKANPKNASTLARRPEIRQRIDQIRERSFNIDKAATERAIERLALTKESLAREYVPLVTSNMRNYVAFSGMDGQPVYDLRNVPDDQWKAIKAMQIETVGGGEAPEVTKIKLWLHEKVGPGTLIAKLFGWIIERKEDITRIEERLRNMTPEQREADAEDLYRRAMQRLLEPPGEDEVTPEGGIGSDSGSEDRDA